MNRFTSMFHALKRRTLGIPILNPQFTDWAGFHYQLTEADPYETYNTRASATDSINVMRYLLKTVGEGWACADLGAHYGTQTMCMWRKAGRTGLVLSVEPDPLNVDRLSKNLQLNGFPTDFVVNAAVSDSIGFAELKRFENANGWQTIGDVPSHARRRTFESIKVEKLGLVDLAMKANIAKFDVVKMDVEGAEVNVLQGAASWLEKGKIDRVIFEVNQAALTAFGFSVSNLLSFWDSFPYTLWVLREDGSLRKLSKYNRRRIENAVGDLVAISERIDIDAHGVAVSHA